jgi:type III pantothenate kinase
MTKQPNYRLLLIDVGNTSISAAYHDGSVRPIGKLSTVPYKTSQDYAVLLKDLLTDKAVANLNGAIISSVVPAITEPLMTAIKSVVGVEPLNVSVQLNTGLTMKVQNPKQVGADRIVTASGAYQRYRQQLIVVDLGTATTFCAVSSTGDYLGGPIMPGLEILSASLSEKTAQLPRVPIAAPERIIGANTHENILAGLVYGHAGAVDRIVSELKKAIGGNAKVVATGGLVKFISPFSATIDEVNENLTFEGLYFIYCFNRSPAQSAD